jgi:hypothetical protein
MTSPILDLHIGAHKTATTFLQTTFNKNRDLLTAHGIAAPNHRQTRKFITIPCQLKGYERIGQDWNTKYSDDFLSDMVSSYVHSLQEIGTRRILMSDENFIGHSGHVVRSGILYNRKNIFMTVLREFLPIQPRRLYVSIREYHTFFSSVYTQYLLDVRAKNLVSPDDFAASIMKKYPSWYNFLRTIMGVFPDSEIHFWDYNNAKTNWRPVLESLLGTEVADQIKADYGNRKRRSMSGRSFAEFKKLLIRRGNEFALDALRDIREEYDEDRSLPLTIFDEDQTKTLVARFRKHSAQLDATEFKLTRVC